jgi:cytoskeletal protein RodZ
MIGRRIRPSAGHEQKPKGFDDYELRLGDLMRGERATLGKSLLDVQRELKIKATYIAAIENCDVSAFETQGFVAGYVRSYARYLQMDPEWAYGRFCDEADFTPTHGMAAMAPSKPAAKAKPKAEHREPLANPNATFVPHGPSLMSGVEPRAVGSVLVLLALIGAVGYGGWTVLQQVQRVQVAPVDQAPGVVAALDPLAGVAKLPPSTKAGGKDAGVTVPSADALDRLYRPQPLDVPVMVPRDGPIAAIDPNAPGGDAQPVTTASTGTAAAVTPADPAVAAALAAATGAVKADGAASDPAPKVVADAAPNVQLMAVRPCWVRVTASDGTVLFEKILDAGEKWTVPQTEQPARLRAGNSGSLYFLVNGKAYGPAASGASVVKKLALSVENLKSSYTVADLTGHPDLAKAVALADASQAVRKK